MTVVWSGTIRHKDYDYPGELLPPRSERSELARIIAEAEPVAIAAPPRPRLHPPLADILKTRLRAHAHSQTARRGFCCCGCNKPLPRYDTRRMFISGHSWQHLNTAELKARCAALGLATGNRRET